MEFQKSCESHKHGWQTILNTFHVLFVIFNLGMTVFLTISMSDLRSQMKKEVTVLIKTVDGEKSFPLGTTISMLGTTLLQIQEQVKSCSEAKK